MATGSRSAGPSRSACFLRGVFRRRPTPRSYRLASVPDVAEEDAPLREAVTLGAICCRSNSVRNNNARRAGAAAGGAASTGCVDATYIIRAASCAFGNRPRELIDQVWQMLTHHASWPYLPPTSSASTLAGHRATVVQTPTASPIVVAVPRGVVTTHCRSWGLADSR